MTYDDLVHEVHGLLSTSAGIENVLFRREAARKMVRGLRRWVEKKERRLRTRGVVLTVTQGALHDVKEALQLSVEVNGRGVGRLVVPAKGVPMFTPKSGDTTPLEWSGNRVDAKRINEIIDESRQRRRVPERDVQGRLSPRLRALFDDDMQKKPRGGLAPVRPAGCMMELPTAVAASDGLALGSGTIDLLARAGRGATGCFVACELKNPAAKVHAYDVLCQAIRYSVALDVEVNGNARIPRGNAADYRYLFGATGEARPRFGAMAVIPSNLGAGVDAAFARLAPRSRPWLGVLLYKEEQDRLVPTEPVRRV